MICARLASGETLTRILKTAGMPSRPTVARWRRHFPAFGEMFTLSRVDGMEAMADECIEIADDSTLDVVTKRDPKGREFEAVDHENIQRDRLRIDVRHFQMSKIARHIYGDRVSHEHSGTIDQRHTVDVSDRERMRRLASFMLDDQRNGVTIDVQPEGVAKAPHESRAALIINGKDE